MAQKKSKPISARFKRYVVPVQTTLQTMGGVGTPAEVTAKVIESLGITEQEQGERSGTGVAIVQNDIAWARNLLRENGIISNEQRGLWKLTALGYSTVIDEPVLDEWIRESRASKAINKKSKAASSASDDATDFAEVEVEEPEEMLDERVLAILKSLSSTGFERFCQALLHQCGLRNIELTKQSGDGGVDGIGELEVAHLVRFKVIFQCKRYDTNQVTSPDIRNFRGAMDGRTDKGIFLTTSTFTADARKEAVRDGAKPIELVDGQRLVEFLKEFRLGLVPVTAYEIDHAFFRNFQ
ncbi:MAG: restriction endonuclease [Armatimonadota bacterium]